MNKLLGENVNFENIFYLFIVLDKMGTSVYIYWR
jgi:hypothetical protein